MLLLMWAFIMWIPIVNFVYAICMLAFGLRWLALCVKEYLLVCRRSATGSQELDLDWSTLQTIGYTIAIGCFSIVPLIALRLCHAIPSGELNSLEPSEVGVLVGCLVWWIAYSTMSIAVLALKETVNPAVVAQWMFKTAGSFIIFNILAGAMVVALYFAYLASIWVLFQLGRINPTISIATAVLLTMFIGQYIGMAVYAMFGRMLSRYRQALQF